MDGQTTARIVRNTSNPLNALTKLTEKVDVKLALAGYAFLMALYVYLPILSVITFSFNSGGITFPFQEPTFDWYYELMSNETLVNAIFTSLKLSFVTMIIATFLSTAIALAYRYKFQGKKALLYLLLAAIIIPGATYGIGANLFLVQVLGLKGGWILAVPIEVVYTTPFGVIIILASLPQDLAKHEQAAAVLGASRLTVFREIVIPQVWSTVLGAAVFSFTLAYNESQRSLLVLGQEVTVANRIFAMTSRTRPTPEIFALGTVSTVFSIILLVSAIYFAFYRE